MWSSLPKSSTTQVNSLQLHVHTCVVAYVSLFVVFLCAAI